MFRYALKSLRANLTRLVATALAVVIGITFLAAGLMLTDAMRAGLTGDVDQQYAGVDLAVVADTSSEDDFGLIQTVPAQLLEEIRSIDGVAAAAGEIQADATVLRPDGTTANLRSQGRAWIEDDQLNPLTLVEGSPPRRDGEVVLDRRLAEQADTAVGQEVDLETPSGPTSATVTGISTFGDQDALDDGGTISFAGPSAITFLNTGTAGFSDIIIRTSGDTAAVAEAIRTAVPATIEVQTQEEIIEDATATAAAFIDFLRPVLSGFAYLSMFVAAFVIFNTFSVVVTQRFRELALIRAIGGTPAQVRRSLIFEGFGIGVGASALGILGGALLTLGVQWLLERFDVGLPSGRLQVTTGTVVLCLVVGTVVTVLSVIVPAVRAGRTKPVEAMRASAVDTSGTSVVRAAFGGTFLVLAIVLLLANRLAGAQWYFLGPGALCLFIGVFIGGPLLARVFAKLVTPPMARIGLTGRLAADNSVRNPRRTATTANALVIGLFLVTLVTVSGEAMKAALVNELNSLSSSDFILLSEQAIAPELIEDVRGTEGVTGVAALRSGTATLAPGDFATGNQTGTGAPVFFTSTDVGDLGDVAGMVPIEGTLDGVRAGTGIAVPDTSDFSAAGQVPLFVGETVAFRAADGSTIELTVDATLEANLDSLFVGYVVSEDTFVDLVGEQPVTVAFVRTEPGQADAVGQRLERAIDGFTGVEVQPGNFVGQAVGSIFDFLIGAVNALLGMSVVVALVGIVNTMTLSIFERRRELGMVRALGMTRQQVGRMIRLEAVMIGLLGTIVGIGSGVLLSWVVVSSIELDDGSLALSFNLARVASIFAVGVLVGVLASILPARRATRLDMLEAMQST